MTLAELITAVRRKLDDATGFTALDEDTIVEALNFAQNEFAVETLCIFSTSTSVAVTTGNPFVVLPAGTIALLNARYAGVSLIRATQHQLDNGYFEIAGTENTDRYEDWRTVPGVPEFIVTDFGPETARLVPLPASDTTLTVETYALPTQMDLEAAPDVEAEIPLAYHSGLVYGALAYLFDIPDLEIYDPNRAIMYGNKWAQWVTKAQIALQTVTRRTERVMALEPERVFSPPAGNTLGAPQSVNTEGGNQ